MKLISTNLHELPYSTFIVYDTLLFSFLQNQLKTSQSKCHLVLKRSQVQPRCCPFCNAVYNNKRELTTHLEQAHSSKQQFKCHICGQNLASSRNLKQHVDNHTGQQAHQCSICGKKFAAKRYYVNHMNLHLGSKMFHCIKCLQSFTYASQLSKHKKICSADFHF